MAKLSAKTPTRAAADCRTYGATRAANFTDFPSRHVGRESQCWTDSPRALHPQNIHWLFIHKSTVKWFARLLIGTRYIRLTRPDTRAQHHNSQIDNTPRLNKSRGCVPQRLCIETSSRQNVDPRHNTTWNTLQSVYHPLRHSTETRCKQ